MCQTVCMHAMKAWRGNWGKAPLILNHGTRGRWCLVIHLGCFVPEEKSRYSLSRRLCRHKCWSGSLEKGKILNPEPIDQSLCRWHYPSSHWELINH